MEDSFSGFHPVVNFTYFAFVIAFSMVFIHPVCLGLSLCCAFAYSIYLNRRKAVRFNFMFLLPMLLIMALVNPAFNHEGVTILAYLRSGNPLTMESILYGVAAATMIAAVIAWFSCYNAVMTSDKFIYLFGRIIPAMSLILSMILRFVPRFKAQIKAISAAQRCVGRDVSNGSVLQRIRHGVTILSIMITWALENAIETADSMKSRGYGLPGRTAFSIFRFDSRDRAAMIFLLAAGAYVIGGAFAGGLHFRYFPSVKGSFTPYTWSVILVYLTLSLMPLVIDAWYGRRWKGLAKERGKLQTGEKQKLRTAKERRAA
ncbi:MAG TPA: energy-coupling factor transporter transmembrane component T [Bacillota bacterium]|nr:energy-coupling factor transporter transmembrane component T [Bacillota bacterium]